MDLLPNFLDVSKERECKLHTKQILGCNNLQVMVGTTGYCGGDGGHGGRTYIKIMNLANTDWETRTSRDMHDNLKEIELLLKGDSELETTIAAFKFITKILEGEIQKKQHPDA